MIRLTLLSLCLVPVLGAQNAPGWRGGRRMLPGHPPGPVMAQLHQMRTQRIQQTLGVSEDRARSIADRWGQFDRGVLERNQQMRQIKQQVNDILVAPGSDEERNARLRPILQQYITLRRQQHEQRMAFENELMNSLSPVQQGRLVFLVDDLQRSLREALVERRTE